jgi:hypothetical protein
LYVPGVVIPVRDSVPPIKGIEAIRPLKRAPAIPVVAATSDIDELESHGG